MADEVYAALTRYGFEYGAAKVSRLASHKGYVVVGFETPRQRLDITVTPTGLIRVGKVVRNEAKNGGCE